MTIMFAGGITIAGASFMPVAEMPEALASHGSADNTSGSLSVSSTHIMGGAVLGITLSDTAIVATDQRISPPSVSYGTTSVAMTQVTDGTWVAYIVDHAAALDADIYNNPGTLGTTGGIPGVTYGYLCWDGLGSGTLGATQGRTESTTNHGSMTNDIIGTPVFAPVGAKADLSPGNDKHNCYEVAEEGAGSGRVWSSVLTDAPTINSNSGAGTNNTGQRNFILNTTSGLTAWPFIQAINMSSTADVTYGTEAVSVNWGAPSTSISLDRTIYPDNAVVHLTIDDPGLNMDPTAQDVWIMDANNETLYWYTNNTSAGGPGHTTSTIDTAINEVWGTDGNTNPVIGAVGIANMGCGDNCALSSGGQPKKVMQINSTKALFAHTNITMTETGANTGVFESSDLRTATDAAADTSMTFSYGGDTTQIIIGYNDSVVTFDAGDAWLPVETATYTITDNDMNKDTKSTETLDIGDPHDRIPTVIMGSPLTFAENIHAGQTAGCSHETSGGNLGFGSAVCIGSQLSTTVLTEQNYIVMAENTTDNSKRIKLTINGAEHGQGGEKNLDAQSNVITYLNVTATISPSTIIDLPGTVAVQYDITGIADQLGSTDIDAYYAYSNATISNGTGSTTNVISLVSSGNAKSGIFDLDDSTGNSAGLASIDSASDSKLGVEDTADAVGTSAIDATHSSSVVFMITHPAGATLATNGTCDNVSCWGEYAIAIDIVNWDPDNSSDTHNGIYRLEAVETGDNTGVFSGDVSYALLNLAQATESTGDPSGSSGFTLGGHDGAAMPSSGIPAPAPGFNGDSITLLLTSGVTGSSAPRININDSDTVGGSGNVVGIQLDTIDHTGTAEFDAANYGDGDTATITIVDADLNQDSSVRETYTNSSDATSSTGGQTFSILINDDDSQVGSDQVVIETSADSGIFVGTFAVPNKKGQDMELQYYDAIDASGGSSTTYAVSSIASNDGGISLDRTSYPVPYLAGGSEADTACTICLNEGDNTVLLGNAAGSVSASLTVTEPDSAADTLTTNSDASYTQGKIKVKLSGSYVYSAGEPRTYSATTSTIEGLGPLSESERGSQAYDLDFSIGGTACVNGGTTNTGSCQTGLSGGKTIPVNSTTILQVEYIDTADAAGATTTFYDSAIFELHTATLSLDKDVYIMGEDAVITLTDPDLNLDYDSTEQYDLRLIQWDSAVNSDVLLHGSYCTSGCTLDPSNLTETGDNTGVFQTVFTIPTSIAEESGTAASPELGEGVVLTYRDTGISGEQSYGDDELDIEASFTISKFGAIIELDKAVYDWTDTVEVTITAPDWNANANKEEQIGTSALAINANTRLGKMCTSSTSSTFYVADESDENTGVFTTEILLTGFDHTMASSQSYTAVASACDSNTTSGKLKSAGNMDGITVSYEWVDGSVALASAIIQWNIAEVELADSSVSPNGSTVIRVTDVDENIDSAVIDTFKVDVFSDSDSGGFQATVSETGEDTGVFEGIVYFSDSAATSGLTLRVSEGDTVTAEYVDVTLPGPDYGTSDDLTIAATATVGTTTPPLERAPAANARVVDAFGSSVAEVSVDQQVQIAADVANSQGKEQAFAYLVQVQDANGVTVSLAWITGSLNAGQSMSPALSWTPSASGSYTATVFVWESVDNPVALSPTVSVSIDVV